MKDFSDIESYTPKKLRTLRNNLNNRLEAFKSGSAKELKPSHRLYEMDEGQCRVLLEQVKKLLSKIK